MAGTDAFKVEGEVIQVVSERLFRVQLANGHRLLAFIPGKNRKIALPLAVGDKVNVQLSPYDLSGGRILLGTERN